MTPYTPETCPYEGTFKAVSSVDGHVSTLMCRSHADDWKREFPGARIVRSSEVAPRLGDLLVLEAMCASYGNGYDGRVGLHSKGGRLDDWYKRMGFSPVDDEDTEDGRFLFMECAPQAARERMRLAGRLEP